MTYKQIKATLKANKLNFPQNDTEFLFLLDALKALKPKRIMEIGSRDGGSLYCFAAALRPEYVYSVDLPNGVWGNNKSANKLLNVTLPMIRKLKGVKHVWSKFGDSHSKEIVQQVEQELNGELLDFLFIDGDHTYAGVKEDFINFSPFVKSAGIIAFHDLIPPTPNVYNVGVGEFWNELKEQYFTQEKIESWGIGYLHKSISIVKPLTEVAILRGK